MSGGWKLEKAKQEARVKRATAEIKGIQRDKAVTNYWRAEIVADLQGETVLLYDLALSSLPGKLAPACAGIDDVSRVAHIIHEAVRELQEGLSRYEYTPGYLREHFAELEGADVFEAAPSLFVDDRGGGEGE